MHGPLVGSPTIVRLPLILPSSLKGAIDSGEAIVEMWSALAFR